MGKSRTNTLLLGLCIVMLLWLGGYVSYIYLRRLNSPYTENTFSGKGDHIVSKNRSYSKNKENKSSSKVKKEKTSSFPKGLEIPAPCNRENSQLLGYENFQLLYDTKQLIPIWVAYELTSGEVSPKNKKVSRSNNFRPDPRLGEHCATKEDYKRSKYDRGHLAPAGDMAFSQTAMDECFYFTNIAPQNKSLNQGTWRVLEEDIRLWAKREKQLYITTGVVASKRAKSIGKHKVAVPEYFYKVVLSVSGKEPKAIGFVFRNEKCEDKYAMHAVSVDSVESLTKLDFFYRLPDNVESKVERDFDISLWK
ncbi:MAG TPA: hypothetical protein DDY68_02245 [Porphyromonadaceae bacterium]|nr:hypothetical protein [Porphyromonadaceae bacterium]